MRPTPMAAHPPRAGQAYAKPSRARDDTKQQQQQEKPTEAQRRRFDGLIAAMCARGRAMEIPFRESLWKRRFEAKPAETLEHMQRLVDGLPDGRR